MENTDKSSNKEAETKQLSIESPILVLGAGGLIGSYLSQKILEDGHSLFMGYHSKPDKAVELQLDYPQQVLGTCSVDTSVPKSADRLFEKLSQTTDNLYAVINCVGNFVVKPLLETSDEEFLSSFESNLIQAFIISKRAYPLLKKHGCGRVLHFTMAGVEKFAAYKKVAAHAASKAALLSLTRSLAVEWEPDNITVNAIAPGMVKSSSPQEAGSTSSKQGKPPITNLDDIWQATAFLLSRQAQKVNGTNLVVSGGWGW